jgi:hypothetical protein
MSVACILPFFDVIDFGIVPLWETKNSTVKIINAGHDVLLISGVNSSNDDIFSTGYTGGITAVASHDSFDLVVSFHPVITDINYSDSIMIESNSVQPGKILVMGQSILGLEDNTISTEIELYPVPVNGEFLYIKSEIPWAPDIPVGIVSVSGETVYSEVIHPERNQELKIDTGSFGTGIFCIRINNGLNHYTKKFIKINSE